MMTKFLVLTMALVLGAGVDAEAGRGNGGKTHTSNATQPAAVASHTPVVTPPTKTAHITRHRHAKKHKKTATKPHTRTAKPHTPVATEPTTTTLP